LTFTPGQRWQSQTEPELGLGVVEVVEGREVVIAYPARDVVRRYAAADAPLARARLSVGQVARGRDGAAFRVEQVIEADGLLVYRGEEHELGEVDLDDEVDVASPENRLRNAQVDDHRFFDLRHDALALRQTVLASPARGFLGGRIWLFDHQLAIARDVCERHRVRVLLADEVGLGKTIEALLILNRLLLSGRVERVLVLVPAALVHQWLAEAYLRFNLVLKVVGRDTLGGGTVDLESEEILAQLHRHQLFVCPLGAEASEALADSEWDLVIVDEAHHLEVDSAEFELVERLARQVEHVVLLSATPDRDGEAAHFRRLALLDPARYSDEVSYRQEAARYRELAVSADRLQREGKRDELVRLLDRHGIGRAMFRNVRARVPGFPRRVPVAVELDGGDAARIEREFLHDIGRDDDFEPVGVGRDPRTLWLREFLDSHAGERVLVLCATRAKAIALADALAIGKREVARFHEDMGVIERDRQAAWFLAPDGPQVLVSSAIGAEGRNFQVARNLVLLDLPLAADRLEQLIGRVDRIGQGEEVLIHSVVVRGSPQARLRRWYAEALRVFERPWHGSLAVERGLGDALVEAALADDETAIEALIEGARVHNDRIVAELESGRDRLLELVSFDAAAAAALRTDIERAEESCELEEFMVDAFERSGLDIESIGGRSYVLRVGLDYERPFPGFVGTEMGVTFDRAVGLAHPERTLLTEDHPMVRDAVDVLLTGETGNASIAKLEGDGPGLLLESLFVAEPTLPRGLRADRFFPPTKIRVVVDVSGGEVELDVESRRRLVATDRALLAHPQIVDRLSQLVEAARAVATEREQEVAAGARACMQAELAPVVRRLAELAPDSPELTAARAELTALDEGLADGRVRLDALRLIVLT
jgi:ATP-dependent helicase HepA